MNLDPSGSPQALKELALAFFLTSFCLHYGALLIAEVWEILVAIGTVTLGGWLFWVVWRLVQGRRDW